MLNYIREDTRVNEDYILLNFILYSKEFSSDKNNYIILSVIENVVNNSDESISVELNDNIH